ncbi:MAG TPA: hypothetical protein VGF79_02990 [Bacteroidia bacterium]
MYKLQTTLTHFRFNTIYNHGPYTVTWYKLDESYGETDGICLTQQELNDLTNYVANNKVNFDNQNYFACDPDETTGCGVYDLLPSTSRQPRNLIIRRVPQMQRVNGNIYPCMDIELLSANRALNHNYNLEFDIIGHIEE